MYSASSLFYKHQAAHNLGSHRFPGKCIYCLTIKVVEIRLLSIN
jgi:hypothetical protein